MQRFCYPAFLLLVLVTGCASNGQTTLLGSAIGSIIGGSIGAMLDAGPRARGRAQNIFAGATIGSLAGGAGGYLLHNTLKKSDKPDTVSDAKSGRKAPPDVGNFGGQAILVPPRVESRYIDDQVRGNTFVPGHLEYQIVEPGRWDR